MKGNKKILVIAALVLLIAASYTTYAIYKTSVGTNANVSTAAWSVEFKNGSNTITSTQNIVFEGSECTNNHVLQGKIAPGASCTKTITLDASGTEVDVAYTATAGAATLSGTAISADANQFTVSLTPASGTIAYNNNTNPVELTLVVTWAGADDAETNPEDISLAGQTITVPVTLVASQVPVSAS